MILRLSDAAEADLEAVGDWIAQTNPERAFLIVRSLRFACEELAGMPEAFALVARHEDTGLRRRVHGSYLIFYRIADDEIVVLRILHGARDYGALLFGEE